MSISYCELGWRPMLAATFFFLLTGTFTVSHELKRVCYLRPDKYLPLDLVLQYDLCTHIIIGFASLDSSSRLSRDKDFFDFCRSCRQSIDTLSGKRPKLMFSIGGGGVGGFELATSSGQNRQQLIGSILDVVHDIGLDGVDIDWEFPSWGHNFSRRFERHNFVLLLQDIRHQFQHQQERFGKRLILSAAVAGQFMVINVSYMPKEIAKYVDFINLMTYDFYIHKWYWPFIGHNSPLYPRAVDSGLAYTFNTEWAANYWHQRGLPKEKIMVGIAAYGKRYTLYSRYLAYPGAIAVSSHADCTYSDVCDFLNLNGTVEKFDEQAKVPYAHNGYNWISYENELSASLKADWLKRNHFGGAMIFSLNADDFRMRCSVNTPFPIHLTVRNVLLSPPNLK